MKRIVINIDATYHSSKNHEYKERSGHVLPEKHLVDLNNVAAGVPDKCGQGMGRAWTSHGEKWDSEVSK